jgi:hypothetical protein
MTAQGSYFDPEPMATEPPPKASRCEAHDIWYRAPACPYCIDARLVPPRNVTRDYARERSERAARRRAEAIAMRAQGATVGEIAKQLGISWTAAQKHLLAASGGVTPAPGGPEVAA